MASKSFDNLIQEIGGLTVLELSDFVKALEEKFGVSAAMPSASAAPAAGAPAAAAEEKSSYKVTLQDVGANKINVIKALKAATSLSLSEAKEKVDNVPSVIAESASKEDSEKIKKALEEAGAKVQLS
jgi:large subunit ribosomal protein L7/L12